MTKPVILAIVGPSGSGKTTMAEYLKNEMGIPVLVSFTTRNMRPGEVDGVDHNFVSEQEMPPKEDMLAYTKFGGYHYWTTISQIPNGICSYVIDEKGLMMLWEDFGDRFDIVPIFVKCNIETLEKRGIDPERLQRDKIRVVIEEAAYWATITNNGDLEEFYSNISQIINLLPQWQHQKMKIQ